MRKLPELAKRNIVVFDPGEKTGVFMLNVDETQKSWIWSPTEILRAAANETGHFTYLCSSIWIIESFRLYGHKANSLTNNAMLPCEIIGMLKVLARRLGVPEVVMQSASEAKGFVDNERLAGYGWKLPTPHEKDAARHAIYYLAKLAAKLAEKERKERNAQRETAHHFRLQR